jgi:hypothetical protein
MWHVYGAKGIVVCHGCLFENVVSPTSMCKSGIAQTCIRLRTLSHYGFESYVGGEIFSYWTKLFLKTVLHLYMTKLWSQNTLNMVALRWGGF